MSRVQPQRASACDVLAQTEGRVLLVNPPVVDRRYPWVKWNQPLDLLKLGTVLSKVNGCEVKLFDFMLPTPKGVVPRRQSRFDDLAPGGPTRWHYGRSWEEFDGYLDGLAAQKWIPTSVWITTLTSFWWQTVPLVAGQVKNKLKRPKVVLYGSYPRLEPAHAVQFCPNVDVVVDDSADLAHWPADFTLYENQKLAFCALDLRSTDLVNEISSALEQNIFHFCFFNDNLFDSFDTRLRPVLKEVVDHQWDLRFHGLCGVETCDFPVNQAQLLADAHFVELHFEPALDEDGLVDDTLYRTVMQACERAGFASPRGGGWDSGSRRDLSGFMWVGRPDDNVEKLVWNALKLLQLTGMVIPKPYSPTPGSNDYALLKSQAGWLEPEDISPHHLPFSGWNGVEASDYEDIYRMTAFLNHRVRSHTFDFFGNTYLATVIRQSLAGQRWAL